MHGKDVRPGAGGERPVNPAVADKEATRPLGRGLEDVSHLFLSRRQADAAERPRADVPEGRAATILLRRSREAPSRSQLRALLNECSDALGEPLRPIDTRLSCDRAGDIDLLAVDAANRLVIVDMDPAEGDALLLRGIIHFAWLVRNLTLLRSNYDGPPIDFSAPPRVFLLARRFPPLFADAVRSVSAPEIRCVRYHALDLGGGLGIFFERLDDHAYDGHSAPEIVFT